MEFLASVGVLTILVGGFFLLLQYSSLSNHTAEYEYLIKEDQWENYFLSWCQDPANVAPKTPRSVALKKFFIKSI